MWGGSLPGDDEVEAYEAVGITVGRLGEGRDDGGDGDDPGDGLLGDAASEGKRCELVGDVDRPAGREALDDGIEGEAVGDGAGGERDDAGQGFEVRRGDGDVGAVLLAGLEERLGVARRAGGEEHEERLVGAADGRRREIGTQGMSTVARRSCAAASSAAVTTVPVQPDAASASARVGESLMTSPMPVAVMTPTWWFSGHRGSIVAETARKPASPATMRAVVSAEVRLTAVIGMPAVSGAGRGGCD